MKDNFKKALASVLLAEQGYQEDPHDAGNRLSDGREGCTNLGVTQAAWEDYVGHSVSREAMRALDETHVFNFYKSQYWDWIQGDQLPTGLDYLVFDFAVNAGISRAVRALQESVGTAVDGVIGDKTLEAVRELPLETLILRYTNVKNKFYKSCRAFPTYGKGWLNRSAKAEQVAISMVG